MAEQAQRSSKREPCVRVTAISDTRSGSVVVGQDRNGEALKGRGKKRPSVETEGRLTIACHMKNLQKIDVVCVRPSLLIFTILVAPHKCSYLSTPKKELNDTKTLNC